MAGAQSRPSTLWGPGPACRVWESRSDWLCALAQRALSRQFQAPALGASRPVISYGQAGSNMKVTVERAALLKSIGHVHRVVERRNTIPILANLLIRAEKGKLGLKATDLDL